MGNEDSQHQEKDYVGSAANYIHCILSPLNVEDICDVDRKGEEISRYTNLLQLYRDVSSIVYVIPRRNGVVER